MRTMCPKCETVKDTSKPKLAFVVTEEDFFPKRQPVTTFCDKCGVEFNIKMNGLHIKENQYESSVQSV